jgi:death-on-curing protein
LWYPSVEDVLALHDDIVSEYPDTHSGVANRGDIEFVLSYINEGSFETISETIHEKAFHPLRLLVANHPFVDANKRTALNTAVVFYFLNGYRFDCRTTRRFRRGAAKTSGFEIEQKTQYSVST